MDNSDWSRNGDYEPSRWEGQYHAATLLIGQKLENNPENCIGIMSMAGKRVEVVISVTNNYGKITTALKNIGQSKLNYLVINL